MIILGGSLLIAAVVILGVLVVRLSAGRPGAIERFTLSGLAIALILGGTGLFAVQFLAPERSEPAYEGPAASSKPNTLLALLPPQSEPLTEMESEQLKWLHRASVEIFVDRPGFGMRRMELPLQDVVSPPKLTSISAQERANLNRLHRSAVDTFTKRPDFGARRLDATISPGSISQGQEALSSMLTPKGAPGATPVKDAHYAFQDVINNTWRDVPAGENETWSVHSVQLVGLVVNPKPVVYESAKMPGMKDVKVLPTRGLNVFEAQALESIRAGEHFIAEKTGKQIRMVAPIFAGNRCIACHDQKGQLLGAFSYVIVSVPAGKKDSE